MTKLSNLGHTEESVNEFFEKGFLDNTEEMAKLAKIEGSSCYDATQKDKHPHLGNAQDTKQSSEYMLGSNSFSLQGILNPEKTQPFEFQSKFSGPEFLESKEHREVMKDVYKNQVKEQQSSPVAGASASRYWIQQKIRSLDLDDDCSSSSVKTFPIRSTHARSTGQSRRRKSIPHHLEPLQLLENPRLSARRGSLPVFMSNSFQGQASGARMSFSLPKITESAVVGRESSSPWTVVSENTEIDNDDNSISGVYKNIFGKKLKQPATTRRRRASSDVSATRKEVEIERKKPKQKWQILIHKRKNLFKNDIDFEPKWNRAKLPSTKLPRLLTR